MTEWFEHWFGEEYLRLYPHRDEQDAERVVALIARHLTLADRLVLDLACGPGRHAKSLAQRGARVVGLDLSLALLRRAQTQPGTDGGLVRADKRILPFAHGAFDVVVNLFTSFGYFADDREHEAVLAAAARVLRSGGWFVMDFLNAAHVAAHLVPHEEQKLEGHRAVIERRLIEGGRFVVKEITLPDDGRRFEERVRLFTPGELGDMLTGAGFTVTRRFGDYDGAPLSKTAPRAILFAERR